MAKTFRKDLRLTESTKTRLEWLSKHLGNMNISAVIDLCINEKYIKLSKENGMNSKIDLAKHLQKHNEGYGYITNEYEADKVIEEIYCFDPQTAKIELEQEVEQMEKEKYYENNSNTASYYNCKVAELKYLTQYLEDQAT